MTGARRIGALLGALAALGTAAATAPVFGAHSKPPATMSVVGTEFDLTLRKTKAARGRTRLQFQNKGEDPHDLNVQARSGGEIETTGVVEKGAVADVYTRLKRGKRYVLWCSLEGHREAGMEAPLKVKRRN